jgi:hypothetical protein
LPQVCVHREELGDSPQRHEDTKESKLVESSSSYHLDLSRTTRFFTFVDPRSREVVSDVDMDEESEQARRQRIDTDGGETLLWHREP